MRLHILIAGVCLMLPASASAQATPGAQSRDPDFSVVVQGTFDPETVAEFNRRVADYTALRSRLEARLPPLRVTTDADEIETFEHRLAELIDDARGSRRGQLFIPAMEGQLKRMLDAEANPPTVAAIMDDGPGEFDVDINETYSKRFAIATMPPNLLLLLPDLPKDLEYRFVGRHFILRDARANIIVDEIPYAIRCRDCVPDPEVEEEPNE